ncbi:MAG: hypothetical protein PCFJNLEI_00033 [Verrucomicrobiae bacterium]|nr:hypothetical protein [Verrucomicrobiae bacterium]
MWVILPHFVIGDFGNFSPKWGCLVSFGQSPDTVTSGKDTDVEFIAVEEMETQFAGMFQPGRSYADFFLSLANG